MKRRLATFDPIVDLDEVVLNGRYVFAATWLRGLLDHGDLDEVVVLGDVAPNRQRAEQAGLGGHLGGRLRLEAAEDAARVVAGDGCLAVHTSLHKGLLAPLVATRALGAGRRPPVTATVHGLAYHGFQAQLLAMLAGDLRPGDALACPSPTVLRTLGVLVDRVAAGLGRAPEERPLALAPIPHGCDLEVFRPRPRGEARAATGLPADRPLLLFVGRPSAENKLDLRPALRALAPLWATDDARRPVLCLVVPRSPPSLMALVADARRRGLDVRLVVDPPRGDLPLYYAAADVFLGLSDTVAEMFGLTVLEAMACGTPVVATEVGGYRDLITDGVTGLLVPTYVGRDIDQPASLAGLREDIDTLARCNVFTALDHGALLAACRRLLGDQPLARRLGQAARAEVEARYSLPGMVASYVALWERASATAAAAAGRGRRGVDLTLPCLEAFGASLTHQVGAGTRIEVVGAPEELRDDIEPFVTPLVARAVDLGLVRRLVARGGQLTVGELRREVEAADGPRPPGQVEAAALWALKQGLVRVVW